MPARLPCTCLAVAATLWLVGCETPSTYPYPEPSKPGTPAPPPARAPTLLEEQQRLRALLDGTPVVVEMTGDGRMRVEVPLKHCFDPGRSAVKPPLAAVLDHVAGGLRLRRGTDVRIAAPSDAGGGSTLAADRAASTRDYLVARGVAATRFTTAGTPDASAVELLVSNRP